MNTIATQLKTTVTHFINNAPKPADWSAKPSSGKWSPKEIMGHIIDSAHINLQRFVRCTYEENFKLIYFQDEWVAAQHYQDADIEDILQLWKAVNMQIVRVLDKYPPDRWQATCDSNRGEPIYRTVDFLANDYIRHMQHHLNQVTQLSHGN